MHSPTTAVDPRAPWVALVLRGGARFAECSPCRRADLLAPIGRQLDGPALKRYETFFEEHRRTCKPRELAA